MKINTYSIESFLFGLLIWCITAPHAGAQNWEIVRSEPFNGVTTSFNSVVGFSHFGFSPGGGQARSFLNNNFIYAAFQAQLDPGYEYRFSWNIRALSSGKKVVFKLDTLSGTAGMNVSDVFSLTSSFVVRQSAVFTVTTSRNYYLIATPPPSGYSASIMQVYFDDFLLERRALTVPVLNFAATEVTLEEGSSTQICVSVADPLVTSYADIVLSSAADPHLSSFTPITLEFPAGSTDPQCFVVQTEPANGQPDLNHTYTLELQNLTGGAVLGEVAAVTVTVPDGAELPERCSWAGRDTTILAPESVYIGFLPLVGENGLCYRWFPDQNISSTYSPYPEVCPDTTTTYIIYITDDQGNLVGSDTVIVTVNPLPAVEITPPNPAICQQTPPGVVAPGGRNNVCSMEPITLSTVETYTVYNWSTGATGPNITVAMPGPYRVTVTDTNGCTTSKEVELAYCTEVTLEVSPTPAQLCEDTLILQANAGFVSYLWSDNSTGSSLIVTEPGTYSVTVQDAGGCFAEEVIEVPYCAATDIDLTIHNGLYDWFSEPRVSWSGGQPIAEDREVRIGAVTVANLNNTDGDYLADGMTELIDSADVNVRPIDNPRVGRNEIDLMRLVIKKSPTLNPAVDGVIKLTKISGNVKLWWKPTKGDSLVAMVNNEFVFDHNNDFLGDTMTVMYIEAIGKSAAVRDIEFQLAYRNQVDTVKATAIWAEQTRGWYSYSSTPIPGSGGLKYLNAPLLLDRLNIKNISEGDQRYGYGPSYRGYLGNVQGGQGDGSSINKKLGGRHLVEYRVFPVGVDKLAEEAGIHFDIARQNRAISATYFSGFSTPQKPNNKHPFLFPWEPQVAGSNHQQKDNEWSTDDEDEGDEDANYLP